MPLPISSCEVNKTGDADKLVLSVNNAAVSICVRCSYQPHNGIAAVQLMWCVCNDLCHAHLLNGH